MKHINTKSLALKIGLSLTLLFSQGCRKYLEVPGPAAQVDVAAAFGDDLTATSVVLGLYTEMIDFTNYANGGNTGYACLTGSSADEFIDYFRVDQFVLDIQDNDIKPNNKLTEGIWNTAYKTLYQANSAIEGLERTTTLTPAVKDQLKGEALFVRAFTHFNLVNIFGDIPLATSTDYLVNSTITRSAGTAVYQQIIDDLTAAQSLLPVQYATTGRVRPNKSAATALLARAYLYTENWQMAEEQSTLVIDNPLYELPNLNDVFLRTSKEAIWQIAAPYDDYPTNEAYWLTISFLGPQSYTLNPVLIADFEPGDQRRVDWIGIYNDGITDLYFPFKYKDDLFSAQFREYSTYLRKAEQYLIRAEARAKQNKLPGAIADLDKVRNRAGLPLIASTNPGISQKDLLTAILHERRVELFTESGHRWFDLKRTDKADAVLSLIKPNWNADDKLYPIPEKEIIRNSKLKQNPGY